MALKSYFCALKPRPQAVSCQSGQLPASLPRMDPLLAAATIGVCGTVIVGVAGFGASIWTTRKTIQHARDTRMWDKRAELYVDALAAVHYRQAKRERDMRTFRLGDEDDRHEAAYLAGYTPPDFHQLEGRMLAFASHQVTEATQASSTAHMRAMSARKSRLDDAAKDRAQEARKAADDADDALVELIRAELQGRGTPIADWQKFPADPGT